MGLAILHKGVKQRLSVFYAKGNRVTMALHGAVHSRINRYIEDFDAVRFGMFPEVLDAFDDLRLLPRREGFEDRLDSRWESFGMATLDQDRSVCGPYHQT